MNGKSVRRIGLGANPNTGIFIEWDISHISWITKNDHIINTPDIMKGLNIKMAIILVKQSNLKC